MLGLWVVFCMLILREINNDDDNNNDSDKTIGMVRRNIYTRHSPVIQYG